MQQSIDFGLDFKSHKKYINGIFKTKEEIIQEITERGKTKIYTVLSFGGGTQSSHLLEMHFQGLINYDYIIFSDTGAEPDFIHDQVKYWINRQKELNNTTPFLITNHKGMPGGLEEMLHRYIETDYQRFQMPVYCNKINEDGEEVPAGMMPRQCTVDFKIIPVKQAARRQILEEHGLTDKQRIPKDVAIIMDIGFSMDEIKRINTYKSPQFDYIYLSYPLVELGESTNNSIRFLEENDFPSKRSRCYLCPFNCDKKDIGMDWMEIIEEEPLSFLKSCYFDESLRSVQSTGRKNMRSIPYLHYSRKPLKSVYSEDYEKILVKYNEEFNDWVFEWKDRIEQKYSKEVEIV